MELVIAIGKPGFRIPAAQAHEHIYGYACGLDMTRRDLQLEARDKGRPWDLGKDFEESSVIADIVPMPGVVLSGNALSLKVNGQVRQSASVDKLIWDIREIIADLSQSHVCLIHETRFFQTIVVCGGSEFAGLDGASANANANAFPQ